METKQILLWALVALVVYVLFFRQPSYYKFNENDFREPQAMDQQQQPSLRWPTLPVASTADRRSWVSFLQTRCCRARTFWIHAARLATQRRSVATCATPTVRSAASPPTLAPVSLSGISPPFPQT